MLDKKIYIIKKVQFETINFRLRCFLQSTSNRIYKYFKSAKVVVETSKREKLSKNNTSRFYFSSVFSSIFRVRTQTLVRAKGKVYVKSVRKLFEKSKSINIVESFSLDVSDVVVKGEVKLVHLFITFAYRVPLNDGYFEIIIDDKVGYRINNSSKHIQKPFKMDLKHVPNKIILTCSKGEIELNSIMLNIFSEYEE